jgi:hypothetical protein
VKSIVVTGYRRILCPIRRRLARSEAHTRHHRDVAKSLGEMIQEGRRLLIGLLKVL